MASFDTRERVKEIAREYGKLVKEELDVKKYTYMVHTQKELIHQIVI